MALSNNPMFSPENLLMLSGNILAAPSLGAGVGTGLQQLGANMAAQQKEQAERQRLMQENTQAANYLRQQNPGQDYSNFSAPMLKAATAATLENQFAKPKFQVLPDGSYGTWDEVNQKFNVLGKATKQEKRNLISTRAGIYDADTNQWVAPPEGVVDGGTPAEHGLNPIWGKDKDGKLVFGTLDKAGVFHQTDLPDGFEPQPGTSVVDLGTSVVVRNNKTGDTVREMPKDVAGVEEQKVLGKDKGEIKAALPSARFTARVVSDEIKEIINDPALPQALGPVESRLPTMREATARVESRIKKLAGQSFLQAREMLRGGGQITDFEGKKAEEAMVRLERAQSVEDFKAALMEFDAAVAEGIRKLEAAAEGREYDPNASAPGMNTTTTGRKWKVLGQ